MPNLYQQQKRTEARSFAFLAAAVLFFILLNVAKCAEPAVTVAITDQSGLAIQTVTGRATPGYTLLDASACNESDSDITVDNATVYQRINTRTTQNIQLIDSQVVTRVLAVFQDHNVYARLFRAAPAAITVGALLANAFKATPWGAGIALGATLIPGIYQAVLPVVHSPEDLQSLAGDILSQAQGTKMAAHTCQAGLVIAHAPAGPVKTEVITVQ